MAVTFAISIEFVVCCCLRNQGCPVACLIAAAYVCLSAAAYDILSPAVLMFVSPAACLSPDVCVCLSPCLFYFPCAAESGSPVYQFT